MVDHTRGPWEVIGRAIMPDPDSKNPDSMLGICEVYDFDGERPKARFEANARLIAAAPDLLEALKEMVRYCDLFPNAAYHIAARAAIAKAEGRS